MKLEYHDNSFTAGVLDGHERTSQYPQLPSWDFSKSSTALDKPREYFFQPGQYAVKLESSRPKLKYTTIPLDKQRPRKPDMVASTTLHIPDRSEARPSCFGGACPPMERRVKDVSIKKCTNRKPIYDYIPPMYKEEHEENYLNWRKSFDIEAATALQKSGKKAVFEFKKDLTRVQQLRTSRVYGNDVNLSLVKTNLTQGPVSVELLPMDSMHEKPQLRPRICVHDLKKMGGRETSKEYIELPPRGRVDDHQKVMNFERGVRSGDSRAETQQLSKLAGAITELRGTRSYDALPRDDHPRPSVSD
jgi:predicted outer membrane protein